MPYSSIGRPKFFIDHSLWLSSLGFASGAYDPDLGEDIDMPSLFKLNPSHKHLLGQRVLFWIPRKAPMNYFAVLGHNVKTKGGSLYGDFYFTNDDVNETTPMDIVDIVNFGGVAAPPEYDGFSIGSFEDNPDYQYAQLQYEGGSDVAIGAVSAGSTYTLPHSADLSLTFSYEYDGVKEIQTKGGASLSNSFYHKSPFWGDLGAWELWNQNLTTPSQAFARSGRRSWDLSFTFLDDGDIFGSNPSLSTEIWKNVIADGLPPASVFDGTDLAGDAETFNFDILTDQNFYSQVIHRTHGSHRFIFQPDSNDNTNFAICKFVGNSFKFTQTAPGLVSCRLKIREVW